MFKIPPPIRTGAAFWLPRRWFVAVYVKRVLHVLSMRKQFQIFKPVVVSNKVPVVDLQPAWYGAIERLPDKPMDTMLRRFSIFRQRCVSVPMAIQTRLHFTVSAITLPCCLPFDRRYRLYANVEKRRHHFERSTFGQHSPRSRYPRGINFFAARCSPYIARSADLIYGFVTQNGCPFAHGSCLLKRFLMSTPKNLQYQGVC
jgi:hypothetical protein